MVTVTENAAKKFAEILANEPNAENKVLRVWVGGFG